MTLTCIRSYEDGAAEPSPRRIAVLDAVPSSARGMTSVLREHGYSTEEWTGSRRTDSVSATPLLLAVRTAEDWEFLRTYAGSDGTKCVVAVLVEPDQDSYGRALRYGARAAVADRTPVDEIVRVLEAALDRRTLLPTEVAAGLAMGRRHAVPDGIELNTAQLHWIQALAAGTTIADLAVQACYSQREMYRSLGELYSRMGARNRTEAVVLATRWGVV